MYQLRVYRFANPMCEHLIFALASVWNASNVAKQRAVWDLEVNHPPASAPRKAHATSHMKERLG